MPVVMLTVGAFGCAPGIKNNIAGTFGLCVGDNMLSLANL
jgi:hypothetical protein